MQPVNLRDALENTAQPTRETWQDYILERIAAQVNTLERKSLLLDRQVRHLARSPTPSVAFSRLLSPPLAFPLAFSRLLSHLLGRQVTGLYGTVKKMSNGEGTRDSSRRRSSSFGSGRSRSRSTHRSVSSEEASPRGVSPRDASSVERSEGEEEGGAHRSKSRVRRTLSRTRKAMAAVDGFRAAIAPSAAPPKAHYKDRDGSATEKGGDDSSRSTDAPVPASAVPPLLAQASKKSKGGLYDFADEVDAHSNQSIERQMSL